MQSLPQTIHSILIRRALHQPTIDPITLLDAPAMNKGTLHAEVT